MLAASPPTRRSPSRASGARHEWSPPISSRESVLAPDIVAWAQAVVETLRREDRFASASVLVPDPAASGLRLAAHSAQAEDGHHDESTAVVPLTGSVSGWVFRMGRPALVGDSTSHAGPAAASGSAARSELAAPILVAGTPIGVLEVKSPRAGEFGIEDLARLERRAASAAASLPRGPGDPFC